jgi:hypothetical protein
MSIYLHIFTQNCIQSSNKVYTISINVWITSIDAHRVHSFNCWWKKERNTPMRVLTSKITKLKKLQETRMQATKTTRIHNGITCYGVNKIIQKNSLVLVIMYVVSKGQ